MNLYIDESGLINNHIPNNKYFVIAIIHATNKVALKRTYKRLVSSNYDELKLVQDKIHSKSEKTIKSDGKNIFRW